MLGIWGVIPSSLLIQGCENRCSQINTPAQSQSVLLTNGTQPLTSKTPKAGAEQLSDPWGSKQPHTKVYALSYVIFEVITSESISNRISNIWILLFWSLQMTVRSKLEFWSERDVKGRDHWGTKKWGLPAGEQRVCKIDKGVFKNPLFWAHTMAKQIIPDTLIAPAGICSRWSVP